MAGAITIVCPNCNHKMRASTEHIGRKGRCQVCKHLVEIRAQPGDESYVSVQIAQTTNRLLRAMAARAGTTDTPGWLTALLGLAGTLLLYLCVFWPAAHWGLELYGVRIGDLFLKRGSVPCFNTLITCWGLAILALKYRAVRLQKSYADRELEFIPLDIGLQIAPSNVEQFLAHLAGLPPAQRLSILGRRIQGALEHFKSRNSAPEVQQFLATQAEIDASGVESGYTLLRAFIWCNPILGFIGTVVGISYAVSGLATSFAGGAEADALQTGLQQVTAGLATAFDTTLLGLLMTIVLLFPTEALRKKEYSMLDRIEAFTNESLLRRMSEEESGISPEQLPEAVQTVLRTALEKQQQWLSEWQAQLAQAGQRIGSDFAAALQNVQANAAQAEAARAERLEKAGQTLAEVFERVNQVTQSWHNTEAAGVEHSRRLLDSVQQVQRTLAESATVCSELLQQQRQAWEQLSAGSLGQSMQGLQRQVQQLSKTLETAIEVRPSQIQSGPVAPPPAPGTPVEPAPVEPATVVPGLPPTPTQMLPLLVPEDEPESKPGRSGRRST